MAEGARSALEIPAGWGLTQAVIHFESIDQSDAGRPFAGSAMVQLRVDWPPSAQVAEVRDRDLSGLTSSIPNLEVLSSGALDVGEVPMEYLDLYVPQPPHVLRQLVLYVRQGKRLYTVTGTHRRERFDQIRGDVLELAARVARGGA